MAAVGQFARPVSIRAAVAPRVLLVGLGSLHTKKSTYRTVALTRQSLRSPATGVLRVIDDPTGEGPVR